MAPVLDVRPDAFVSAAADLYRQTFVATTNAFYELSDTLDGCRSMAGADPAGAAWSSSYDAAVLSTVQGWQTLATAVYRVVCLIDQSGRNHEAAESASRTGCSPEVSVGRFDPSFSTHFDALPSGGGGASDSPTGWGLIEHAVGYVWPGGHQDRLRAAASAWDAAARTVDGAADGTSDPCLELVDQRSPEVEDALHTIWGLARHLHELAHACRALARTCRGLASHIDEMRSHVEHELVSLLAQTVVIEGIGAAVSFFSFGAAEAPTQAVEASRVEAVAAAVRGFLKAFVDLVDDLVDSIPSIGEIGQRIGAALQRLAGVRIRVVEVAGAPGLRTIAITRDERITSTAMSAEERGEAGLELAVENGSLPEVKLSRQLAEKKFKHAADLGVNESRGRVGFERFQQRVREFIDSPGTVRKAGTYRGEDAVLNYDRSTRQLVLQHPDGTFWSAWRLTPRQLRNVDEGGELGLG